jgi:CBS domain containing-hemolysin-like protein
MEVVELLKLFAILLLVVGNAFFVGAEIALTSARRSRIQQLADAGNSSAQMVQTLHAEPERFYSVTQIGITLMSLALGAIGVVTITTLTEPTIDWAATRLSIFIAPQSAHAVAHTTAQVFAFVAISVLHIVGGELAPKVYAFHKPEVLSLAVARLINLLHRILYPFIWFLNHASNGLLRVLGQKDLAGPGGGHFSISEEELRTILASSETHGILDASESAMIRGVFDLGERTAKDVMVPRTNITGIPNQATIADALKQFRKDRHHRYPVYDGTIDKIVGILSIKELLMNIESDSAIHDKRVAEIMLPVLVIPGSQTLNFLLREFTSSRQQMAIVIDEFGGTAGLVTFEDVMEEVVGEYEDEFSPGRPPVTKKGPTSPMVFNGQSPLSEVALQTDLDIPVGDYSTLAGLVYHRLGRVPGVGDFVELDGFKLTVEEMHEHRITQVGLEAGGTDNEQSLKKAEVDKPPSLN